MASITQILRSANRRPLKVKDIHELCERMLDRPVNYRSVKNCLNEHCRRDGPFIEKPGLYRLKDALQEQ